MALPPRNGLSLCAGGGGLDMGLSLAEPGFGTACYVEIEDYPRQTLIAGQRAGYLHSAPIWGDLKQFSARPWRGIIDTVLAGYPCQPFSQAGQRKGEDDPRHLWPDVARIIDECQPRWVFLENVAGHITLGLEAVLRTLRDMGFAPAAGLFSAEEVGATHERQRVFIVAHRQDTDRRSEQPTAGTGCRRTGPAGNGSELAHAHGWNTSAEWEQRSRQLGFQPEGRITGERPVVHAKHTERRSDITAGDIHNRDHAVRDKTAGWPGEPNKVMDNPTSPRCDAKGIRPDTVGKSRECLSGEGRTELADANLCPDTRRLDSRRHPGGPAESENCNKGKGHSDREWIRVESGVSGFFVFPPGPDNEPAWSDILGQAPDIAPAVSLRCLKRAADHYATLVATGRMAETKAESKLRRMADGMAARSRTLRLLGNGVCPLAAAHAWRTLSAAHGLGRVDLDPAQGTPTCNPANPALKGK